MIFSYFPGCTLKTKAKDLDRYGLFAAEKLGFTLEEVKDWQCCGGAYTMARDEIASKLSSVRTLVAAREAGHDLVTLCSACHNVVKQVNRDMAEDDNIATKANNYMKLDKPYHGETTVLHYLEVLRDKIGFDKVAEAVKAAEDSNANPFKGKKIAAYYGCLLLRPNSVMQMDNPENPRIIEDFITSIGGTPVVYAMRNECCGGYVTMEDKSLAAKKSNAVIDNAKGAGAEMIITACPLCLYNLKKATTEIQIAYFTQVLAAALGNQEAIDNLNSNACSCTKGGK